MTLTKYVDPLPVPGVMQSADGSGTYYEIGAYRKVQQLHQQLPPTVVWAYGSDFASAGYPARTIEARRGVPIRVKWTNELWNPVTPDIPLLHPLPVDQTLHWADPLESGHVNTPYSGPVPLVTHLHGGEVAADSDGFPEAWFTPGYGLKGPAWTRDVYEYPNEQPPTTLWYHDHALGITRLNVYMGLAGLYLLRDPDNEPAGLPSGPYEIPLVIQDRLFNTDGSFAYPTLGVNPADHPYWAPEFFGDTILVNGKVWPYLDVEPRKYRFRFVNGSNARFYSLRLLDRVTGAPGPSFRQIGTDGGYLAAPVVLNDPAAAKKLPLIMAPGERADVIIDFAGLAPGTQLILDNSARAPYPAGAPPGPGTTGQIMLFRVGTPTAPDASVVPATLNVIPKLLPQNAVKKRTLTLNEVMGPAGPLAAVLDGKTWMDEVTETPALGTTEVWEIVNLTMDAHPIHLHLAQFQLWGRQKFQMNRYMSLYMMHNPVIPAMHTMNPDVTPYLQGPFLPPDPNEMGWKDTVRVNPGQVTWFVVRWAPVDEPEFEFDATQEPGYVWHCHILEHEDNEMMRPLCPED